MDLITIEKFGRPEQCVGAYVLDGTAGRISAIVARATVLATGGAGQLYRESTNPPGASGDGMALAWRALASHSPSAK